MDWKIGKSRSDLATPESSWGLIQIGREDSGESPGDLDESLGTWMSRLIQLGYFVLFALKRVSGMRCRPPSWQGLGAERVDPRVRIFKPWLNLIVILTTLIVDSNYFFFFLMYLCPKLLSDCLLIGSPVYKSVWMQISCLLICSV